MFETIIAANVQKKVLLQVMDHATQESFYEATIDLMAAVHSHEAIQCTVPLLGSTLKRTSDIQNASVTVLLRAAPVLDGPLSTRNSMIFQDDSNRFSFANSIPTSGQKTSSSRKCPQIVTQLPQPNIEDEVTGPFSSANSQSMLALTTRTDTDETLKSSVDDGNGSRPTMLDFSRQTEQVTSMMPPSRESQNFTAPQRHSLAVPVAINKSP